MMAAANATIGLPALGVASILVRRQLLQISMAKLGYTWLLLANDQVVNQRFRCLKRGQGRDLSLLVVEGFGLLTGKNQLPRQWPI
jgi:hypothetical protein